MPSSYLTNLGKAFRSWWLRDAFSQSAATAYYAVFSLPGLLMIVMAVATMALQQQRVENELLSHIHHVLGPDVASSMRGIMESTENKNRDVWAFIIGIITLLFGATGLFAQLQKSLNQIWQVEVKKSTGLADFLKTRLAALGISTSIGFLLLVSLLLTAALTAVSQWISNHFSTDLVIFFYILNYIFSFLIISVLFALIYKVLPDIELKWRDALHGGIVAAFLFTTGEYGLSFYFKLAKPETTFGTAGSIILFLLWVFYSCLVLLYGAEFLRRHIEHNQEIKPPPKHIAKRKKI